MADKKKLTPRQLIITAVIVGLLWTANHFLGPFPFLTGKGEGPKNGGTSELSQDAKDGAQLIDQAFRDHRSDVLVETGGRVIKAPPDDNEGSRHQRFIVRLANQRTVLIAHNIDLAPRVPLRKGDELSFKGEYEWNERGGVVHWTHKDPRKRHAGGWIRHKGKVYE